MRVKPSGSITIDFAGTSHAPSDRRQFAEGRSQLSDASGHYPGLRGHRSFLVAADGPTGQILEPMRQGPHWIVLGVRNCLLDQFGSEIANSGG